MPQNEARETTASRRGFAEPALQHEIEQFLYFEAELLDDRQIADWMALMAPEIRYFMPIHSTRSGRETAKEWTGPNDLAYFDEDKDSLALRLRKLQSNLAWAEEPPSRTRHLVTNVRIRPGSAPELFEVKSNFVFYRSRGERQRDVLSGERHDVLRRSASEPGFEIVRRTIFLDESTLIHNNISFFL